MSTFRVMQFNMQFGQVWDPKDPDGAPIDIAGTLAEIKKHRADLILLQEVEHAGSLGPTPTAPRNFTQLSSQLNGEYHGYFELPKADPRELPFGIGLAIFSRSPLTERLRLELPSPPVHFDFMGEDKTPTDRLAIGATTTLGGRTVRVFNTHLLAFFMLGTSSQEHPQQRRTIAELMRGAKGPALVGGDFNVSSHQSLVAQMAEVGCSTVQQTQTTWLRRPYVLDHIFFNRQLRCVNHAVVPTQASDHQVLIADFDFAVGD